MEAQKTKNLFITNSDTRLLVEELISVKKKIGITQNMTHAINDALRRELDYWRHQGKVIDMSKPID